MFTKYIILFIGKLPCKIIMSSEINIKEIESKEDLKKFVMFPFDLYKDSKYWVAPIIKEELEVLGKEIMVCVSIIFLYQIIF